MTTAVMKTESKNTTTNPVAPQASQQNPNDLNENNLLMYAIKNYDKPNSHYITSEFEEDFKRVQYLQKLFCRYEKKGELKERLILNHLIVLYNIFGAEAAARILFLRISSKHRSVLKTFLLYLNIMPDTVHSINGADILSGNIPVDMKVAHALRKI
jgi:hypothetical protein